MSNSLINKIFKIRNIMYQEFDTLEFKHVNPVNLLDDCMWDELELFKKNDKQVGKVIYCLNNFPNLIYDIMLQTLISNGINNMSTNFYAINIFKINNSYNYNFDEFYHDI